MIRRNEGFTLIELLITMSIFIVIVSAIVMSFLGLLGQYKQQSKMAETNIEGIIGLDILRRDIEHAGYGLPWNGLITYTESTYLTDAPTGPPKAVVSVNGATTTTNGSDILVIKSLNVSGNDTSQKWTPLKDASPYINTWTTSGVSENLADADKVIVISPGGGSVPSTLRMLQTNGGASFSTTLSTVKSNSVWRPIDASATWVVYGLAPSTVTPERPFNRADYFISTPADIPRRCATNTGVLYKAVLNHGGGYQSLPLLDCVADMQVIFELDTNGDGIIETESNDISGLTAQQIRDQVKEVRVYILAQEGQIDSSYTHSNPTVIVGQGSTLGRTFNLSTIIPNYQHYHWKVYTLAVKPTNLK